MSSDSMFDSTVLRLAEIRNDQLQTQIRHLNAELESSNEAVRKANQEKARVVLQLKQYEEQQIKDKLKLERAVRENDTLRAQCITLKENLDRANTEVSQLRTSTRQIKEKCDAESRSLIATQQRLEQRAAINSLLSSTPTSLLPSPSPFRSNEPMSPLDVRFQQLENRFSADQSMEQRVVSLEQKVRDELRACEEKLEKERGINAELRAQLERGGRGDSTELAEQKMRTTVLLSELGSLSEELEREKELTVALQRQLDSARGGSAEDVAAICQLAARKGIDLASLASTLEQSEEDNEARLKLAALAKDSLSLTAESALAAAAARDFLGERCKNLEASLAEQTEATRSAERMGWMAKGELEEKSVRVASLETEIKEARESLRESQVMIDDQKETIAQLQLNVLSAKNALDKSEGELQTERDARAQLVQKYDDEIKEFENRARESESQLTSAEERAVGISVELESVRSERDSVGKDFETAKLEIGNLLVRLEEGERKIRENEEQQQEQKDVVVSLTRELEALSIEHRRGVVVIHDTQRANETLSAENNSLSFQLDAKTKELFSKTEELSGVYKLLSSHEDNLSQLHGRESLAESKAKTDALAAANASVEIMRSALTEKNAEINLLKYQIKQLSEEGMALKSQLTEASSKVAAVSEELLFEKQKTFVKASPALNKNEITALNEELKKEREQRRELFRWLQQTTEKNRDLQQQIQLVQSSSRSIGIENHETNINDISFISKQDISTDLIPVITEGASVAVVSTSATQNSTNFIEGNSRLQSELIILSHQTAALTAENQKLFDEITATKIENSKLAGDLAHAAETNGNLKSQLEDLHAQIETEKKLFEENHDLLVAKLATAEQRARSLSEELDAAAENKIAAENSLSVQKNLLREAQDLSEARLGEYAEIRQQYDETLKKLDEAEFRAVTADSINKELSSQIRLLKRQKDSADIATDIAIKSTLPIKTADAEPTAAPPAESDDLDQLGMELATSVSNFQKQIE